MGKIYYETAPMPQTDGINIVVNGDGKLDLGTDVTTKLSKVDTTDNLSVELAKKINKPASATNGQVLTYNGTSNEWEAQDSKGGSITEPTDLEKGIIGGDEWVNGGSYIIGKSVVIDENKLYLLVGDGGSTTKPSTDTTHSIWEETSISVLNSKVNSSLDVIETVVPKTNVITKGDIVLRKQLNIVFISFLGKTTDLPKGYNELGQNNPYPPKERVMLSSNISGSQIEVCFETDGIIRVYVYGNQIASDTNIFFNVAYIV